MRNRAARHALVVIGLAAACLAGLWRVLPAASPPIYDGICIADPYRSLGGSPPPSSATKQYPASAQSQTDEVITDENPAQAQVLMMQGTFSSPGSPFSVSITPVQPPVAPPSGYALDGNAYRIVATDASGKMLQPATQTPVTIVLRGTSKTSNLTMFVDSGNTWAQLKTFNAGCGFTYEAVSQQAGYFGLFYQQSITGNSGNASNGGNGGQSGGAPIAVIVAVVIVVVIA
ncbi:MAG: hypothetical protein ABR498_08245, partial [Candidatus Dormibacteria bacterium]